MNVHLIKKLNGLYEKYPFFGYRKMHVMLTRQGYNVNRKRIQRLMKKEGLEAIRPKRNLSKANKKHKIYPYLLRDLVIDTPDQVWQIDITYIKTCNGYVYLAVVIDVYSRMVVGWYLSPFINTEICENALTSAFIFGMPGIVNTDQGSQFTSKQWITLIQKSGIEISMDGKGRWADNIYIERFFRSIKYEAIFLHGRQRIPQLRKIIKEYIRFYNTIRPHQSLRYKTPDEVYRNGKGKKYSTEKLYQIMTNELSDNSQIQATFWS